MSTVSVTCRLCSFSFAVSEEAFYDALEDEPHPGKVACVACCRWFDPEANEREDSAAVSDDLIGYVDESKTDDQKEFDQLAKELSVQAKVRRLGG